MQWRLTKIRWVSQVLSTVWKHDERGQWWWWLLVCVSSSQLIMQPLQHFCRRCLLPHNKCVIIYLCAAGSQEAGRKFPTVKKKITQIYARSSVCLCYTLKNACWFLCPCPRTFQFFSAMYPWSCVDARYVYFCEIIKSSEQCRDLHWTNSSDTFPHPRTFTVHPTLTMSLALTCLSQ